MTALTDFAKAILLQQEELDDLRYEVARLRDVEEKYKQLLDESLQHSQRMVGGILGLVMKPGVMDALVKDKEAIATPTPA